MCDAHIDYKSQLLEKKNHKDSDFLAQFYSFKLSSISMSFTKFNNKISQFNLTLKITLKLKTSKPIINANTYVNFYNVNNKRDRT